MSDKIFAFNTNHNNKCILSYWSFKTFMRSWILSLIYLVVMLFVVGYVDLDKNILWQFVFLFVLYICIFYSVVVEKNSSLIKLAFLILVIIFVFMLANINASASAFAGAIAFSIASANSNANANAIAIASAIAISSAIASAFAYAYVLASTSVVAFAFAIMISSMSAHKIARVRKRVRVGAIVIIIIIMGIIMVNGDSSLTDNIFQLLPKLKDMSQKEIGSLFIVFFFLTPISNALIDSLSLSVSRYEFQKLLNKI
jgi:hypothetical protein